MKTSKSSKSSPKLRMMSSKSMRFGMKHLQPNTPRFSTPLELSLGQTYQHQRTHYNKIPSSLLTYNLQGTGAGSNKNRMQLSSKNFPYTVGSLGRSSLPPFKNINSFGAVFSLRGVSTGLLPPGTIGNVNSSALNIKIPGNFKKNYFYNSLLSPPATTRGAVSSAQGTPDYYNKN